MSEIQVSPRAVERAAPVRPAPLRDRPARSGGDAEWRFVLGDPDVAADVVATLREQQPFGVLRQGRLEARVKVSAEPGPGLTLIVGNTALFEARRSAALHVELHDVLFVLEAELAPAKGRFMLAEPMRISSINRRGAARVQLERGAASLRFSEASSQEPMLVDAEVHDLAADGVAITGTGDRALPTTGFAALLQVGNSKIPCFARVRHERPSAGMVRYGVNLETSRREELVGCYLLARFPELVERGLVEERTLATLLESSGYLGLREGTRPPRSWFAPAGSRGVSRDVCYRAPDGAITGHFSITRAYSKAWLGHQMATVKGHPATVECRRTLYLHVASFATLMDGEDTTVLGYFDREKPWHKIFFYDFVKWIGNPSLAVIAELDRFERETPGPVSETPARLPRGYEVGDATPEELVTATALIRAQLPELVAEALDIRPDRLASDHLHDAYRGVPLDRTRRVQVMRQNGKLAGVALCEMGSRELSLFNLFNTAFFFFRRGAEAPPTDAQLALLAHARRLYASRGEHNPLIVAPSATFDAAAEPGTVLAETMGLIAKSGRSLRQYENFIRYQFGKYTSRAS
ncbi:MAG TPA: hypothetical protein VH062_13395 [Polyangiaceae bacterium]|jgi:hypothetical protein|nr:hypothetical protein [Polyangiaceae bacterium]